MSKDCLQKQSKDSHNASPFQPQLQFLQEYCKSIKKQLKEISRQSHFPSSSKALQNPPSLLLIPCKDFKDVECRQLSRSAFFRAPKGYIEPQWNGKKQQAKLEMKPISKNCQSKHQKLDQRAQGNYNKSYFSKKKLGNNDDDRLYTFSSTSSTLTKENAVGIDDFEIGRKLGSGKSGSVFMAMHKKTKSIFGLKIINKQRKSAKFWEQLSRQIKIQSFLNHPNIVKLYGFFSDTQNIYLVQELCLSGELHGLIKRKHSLSEQTVRIVTEQLCEAIDYLHFHKVIHRDLKPENILCQEGVIKISDFGWSISSPQLRSTLCGTPVYLSPEAIGKKHYDHKIDVWSVGILTYELLFGCVPFLIEKRQDFSKIVQICQQRLPTIQNSLKIGVFL